LILWLSVQIGQTCNLYNVKGTFTVGEMVDGIALITTTGPFNSVNGSYTDSEDAKKILKENALDHDLEHSWPILEGKEASYVQYGVLHLCLKINDKSTSLWHDFKGRLNVDDAGKITASGLWAICPRKHRMTNNAFSMLFYADGHNGKFSATLTEKSSDKGQDS